MALHTSSIISCQFGLDLEQGYWVAIRIQFARVYHLEHLYWKDVSTGSRVNLCLHSCNLFLSCTAWQVDVCEDFSPLGLLRYLHPMEFDFIWGTINVIIPNMNTCHSQLIRGVIFTLTHINCMGFLAVALGFASPLLLAFSFLLEALWGPVSCLVAVGAHCCCCWAVGLSRGMLSGAKVALTSKYFATWFLASLHFHSIDRFGLIHRLCTGLNMVVCPGNFKQFLEAIIISHLEHFMS